MNKLGDIWKQVLTINSNNHETKLAILRGGLDYIRVNTTKATFYNKVILEYEEAIEKTKNGGFRYRKGSRRTRV